jgi:hypothetical protein
MGRKEPRDVVYVDRGGDSSAKWLFWGACLGAGLALMYAPRSGEETRRSLQRRLWKLRAMTEEKIDDLVQQYGPGRRPLDSGSTGEYPVGGEFEDEDEDDFDDIGAPPAGMPRAAPPPPSAREELERRLADARSRRRRPAAGSSAPDLDEPLG